MKLLNSTVCLFSLYQNLSVKHFLLMLLLLKSMLIKNQLYFRNSDFYVKCFSLIFRCISGVVQNNPSSQQLSLDIQLVTLYTSLLPYLSHFTFFPLLMKTVFETSLLVCNQHVRGFEEISYYALNEFFSFMISAFDRFEYVLYEKWNEIVVVSLRVWNVCIWCIISIWRINQILLILILE